jgi:hypothetical protein
MAFSIPESLQISTSDTEIGIQNLALKLVAWGGFEPT